MSKPISPVGVAANEKEAPKNQRLENPFRLKSKSCAVAIGVIAIGMGGYFNSRPEQPTDQVPVVPHPSSYPKPPEEMKSQLFRTHMCTAFTMDDLLLTADHCIKTSGKIYDAKSDVGILNTSLPKQGYRQATVEERSNATEVSYFDIHSNWEENIAILQRSIPENITFYEISNFLSRPGNSGSPIFIKVNDQYVVIGVLSASSIGEATTTISLLPENFTQNIDRLGDPIPGGTKIVNSDYGVIRTFKNYRRTQNGEQRADEYTLTDPNGDFRTNENWTQTQNGDEHADEHTLTYSNGEIRTLVNWTQTQNAYQRADKFTIKYLNGDFRTLVNWTKTQNGEQHADEYTLTDPNNLTETYENWTQTQNGEQRADKRTILYLSGEIKIYENWILKNGEQRADKLTIKYPNGHVRTYENWTQP